MHECYLDLTKAVAKRAWSYEEIESNIPQMVCNADKVIAKTGIAKRVNEKEEKLTREEAKTRAERCQHYWNVERHCFEKLENAMKQQDASKKRAVPSFLGVFGDDGSGTKSDFIVGYGAVGVKKEDAGWFDKDEAMSGHEWMVFESVESMEKGEKTMTLLDAMKVRICVNMIL